VSVIDLLINLIEVFIYPGVIFVVFISLLLEWVDRKVYARAQNRIGPYYVGPHGILQPFADILKLLAKEDITPGHVERLEYLLSPMLILYLSLVGIFMIPTGAWGSGYSVIHFEGDYLLVLTLATLTTVFMFLTGWGSFNRFGAIGSLRALLLIAGYEIPLFICAAAVILEAKTLCLSKISAIQGGGIWFLVTQPIGFLVSLISIQAELERIPFDIPEAETEIVAGWLTEFTGRKLALMRLANDVKLFLFSSLVVTLYLGGPWFMGQANIAIFLVKVLVVVILTSIIRALFARFRIDQALSVFWKYVIPLSLIQVIMSLFIG